MLATFPSTLSRSADIELRGTIHTCCPFDGRADTSRICLTYEPHDRLVEMASVGAYLLSRGGETISHEALTETLYRAFEQALSPHWMMVTDDFERDGVQLRVRMQSALPIGSREYRVGS